MGADVGELSEKELEPETIGSLATAYGRPAIGPDRALLIPSPEPSPGKGDHKGRPLRGQRWMTRARRSNV